jgi:hypothetical protein
MLGRWKAEADQAAAEALVREMEQLLGETEGEKPEGSEQNMPQKA